MEEIMAYLAVFVINPIYAAFFLLIELTFNAGMNPFVFSFYRQAVATVFLAPIAFFIKRKTTPRLSLLILIKIFVLTLGITICVDLSAVGVKYTSASLGAAVNNSLPALTFFLALLLRMEKVNIKSSYGIMKIAGVSLSMGGVATMALYKGPLFKLLHHHNSLANHFHHHLQSQTHSTKTWIKGVCFMLLSQISWALWLVLQGAVLKSYPSKLRLTTLQFFFSTIQSLFVAVAFARDIDQWKLKWNLPLVSVLYAGIVVNGISYYLQAWVIEKKGPVFLAMTTPLSLVITIIVSVFILGETISLGSVLGAVLLVGGLYFVLWGKTKEEQRAKAEMQPNKDADIECKESGETQIAS
ncbi:nodulin MtN21 /EamA-like transporter family protein [Perilla frutescens var. frutescens]|nr:nodulin MtN21 /EamA-like transporter family protein [Perilla frutescens var. frutescens]